MLPRGGLFMNWMFIFFLHRLNNVLVSSPTTKLNDKPSIASLCGSRQRAATAFRVPVATQHIPKCSREVDCLLIECSYFLHRFGIGFGLKTTQKCSHGGVPETPGRGQGCPRAMRFEKTWKTGPFGIPTGAPFRTLWVLMGVFRATFWRPNRVLDVIFS